MRRSNVACGPGFFDGLTTALGGRPRALCLSALLLSSLFGCGHEAQQGDCGPILSSGECNIARSQLGKLDDHPPADVTNRFGRCVKDGTSECLLEDKAVKLGQRLFFDKCLSAARNVACVSCHEPKDAFADGRNRPVMTQSMMFMVNGSPVNMALPLIDPLMPDSVTTAPPAVQPRLDSTNTPLASWDGQRWVPVVRRPGSSFGANAGGTGRHSPSLFNIAYGAVAPPLDGGRVAGVIWAPWDGRYDSHWALVADVLEFGATQGTNRAHVALRIFRKHKAEYEDMVGTPMPPGFDSVDVSGKYIYPRNGSPTYAVPMSNPPVICWWDDPSKCTDPVSLPPSPQVRDEINAIFVNAGKAMSSYMRRLRANHSPYDAFIAGQHDAMSQAAQRGLRLFIGKAECIMCHSGPNFTDWRFHNLGVPIDDPERRLAGSLPPQNPDDLQKCFDGFGPAPICPDPGRQGWQLRAAGQCAKDTDTIDSKTFTCQRVDQPPSRNRYDIAMDCRSSASDATDKDQQCLPATVADVTKCAFGDATSCAGDPLCEWSNGLGRCIARALPAELGQFKTPSLRNVGLTFPYMHNGMLFDYGPGERGETAVDDPTPHLTRVVEFYDQGGGQPDVGKVDPLIHPLHLGKPEIADLVEFLKALTDNSLTTASDPLTLPPTDLLDVSDCPDPLP